MTKAELISEITKNTGLKRPDVQLAVESICHLIKETVIEGKSIYIRGFGTFTSKKRAQKVARNISKNTAIIVEEHSIPIFKPSQLFMDKVKHSAH